MATFLVAHGAWSAGWAWKKMRPLMRTAGHEFWTPTYTGLGERAHLANPNVGLDTHIQDIVAAPPRSTNPGSRRRPCEQAPRAHPAPVRLPPRPAWASRRAHADAARPGWRRSRDPRGASRDARDPRQSPSAIRCGPAPCVAR